MSSRSFLGAFYSTARQINKGPPRIIQLSMNKSRRDYFILYLILSGQSVNPNR